MMSFYFFFHLIAVWFATSSIVMHEVLRFVFALCATKWAAIWYPFQFLMMLYSISVRYFHYMSQEKTEASQTYESLSFLDGWRAFVVEKIAHIFLNNQCVADDGFVLLVDMDDDINKAMSVQCLAIWLLISCYVTIDF